MEDHIRAELIARLKLAYDKKDSREMGDVLFDYALRRSLARSHERINVRLKKAQKVRKETMN